MFKASSIRELLIRRSSIERFIDVRCKREDRQEIWQFFLENSNIGLAIAKNFEKSNQSKKEMFIDTMAKPTLNIIFAGRKGGGKTALAYWIAEELYNNYNKNTCILFPINFNPNNLPHYFYPANHEDEIDNEDFCIFDEAQIRINARKSSTNMNVNFTQFLTIQRHHGISMFMVQQDLEMSDVNEFRLADGFIFKPSGITQLKEKMAKGNVILKFLEFLRPLNNKETLYISSDLQKIILFENPLATFWNDELSTPSKNVSLTELREKEKAQRTKKPKPKRETEEEILKKEYG